MLNKAILIIAIANGTETVIDYEVYTDIKHCSSVSDNINNYIPNKERIPYVQSVCIELNDISEMEV